MRATLERGKPHERAVAMGCLGEAGEARARDAVPLIARELVGEYPLLREWAKRALVSILGRCDVDLTAKDDAIAQEAAACARLTVSVTPSPDNSASDNNNGGTPRDEDPGD